MAEESTQGEAAELSQALGWDAAYQWLATLPRRRNVSDEEIDRWLVSNREHLAAEILSAPRDAVYEKLKKQHKIIRQGEESDHPMRRFKQSDKWKPVWAWLESLDEDSQVGQKEIAEWLNQHPSVEVELEACQSRRNLVKYIQKCFYIVMKKKKKQREDLARAEKKENFGKRAAGESSFAEDYSKKPWKQARTSRMDWSKPPSDTAGILAFPADDDEDNNLWTMDKEVVKRRYELLCQLQVKLQEVILKTNGAQPKTTPTRRTSSIKLARKKRNRTSWSRRAASASSDSEQSNGAAAAPLAAAAAANETAVEPSLSAWACSQASPV